MSIADDIQEQAVNDKELLALIKKHGQPTLTENVWEFDDGSQIKLGETYGGLYATVNNDAAGTPEEPLDQREPKAYKARRF